MVFLAFLYLFLYLFIASTFVSPVISEYVFLIDTCLLLMWETSTQSSIFCLSLFHNSMITWHLVTPKSQLQGNWSLIRTQREGIFRLYKLFWSLLIQIYKAWLQCSNLDGLYLIYTAIFNLFGIVFSLSGAILSLHISPSH